MKRHSFLAGLLALILPSASLIAQGQSVPLGGWTTYFPYNKCVSVTQSESDVYFATSQAVFSIDKSEGSYRYYNKVTGLSDAGVKLVKYNRADSTLIIVYQNSNIDLLKNGQVYNLPDIMQSTVQGDKTINGVWTEGDNAYLASNLGVIKLNLTRREVVFTAFSGTIAIEKICVFNGYIYAATLDGMFRINENASTPAYWGGWERLGGQGIYRNYEALANTVFNNRIYASINDTLKYSTDGVLWNNVVNPNDNTVFTYAGTTLPQMEASWDGTKMAVTINQARQAIVAADNSWVFINGSPLGFNNESIIDQNGLVWSADSYSGAFNYSTVSGSFQRYIPNAPYAATAFDLVTDGAQLWAAAGSTDSYIGFSYNNDGVYHYQNGDWTNFNYFDTPDLNSTSTKDFIALTIDAQGNCLAGSYGSGLWRFNRDGTITNFNTQSTTLRSPVAYGSQEGMNIRISGMAKDNNGNIWMSNHLASKPINVLKRDGTWRSFGSAANGNITKMTIDKNGYKWFAQHTGNLLVYDSGSDIDNPNDDKYIELSTSNSELPNQTINALATDLDGEVWIGTTQGICVFRCTGSMFSSGTGVVGCRGEKPIVTRDNFNSYLLKTESVTSIVVDGGNRKWVGTASSGVFLLSPDAEEQIAHYTKENSPLPDNNISSMAYNGRTGEVFIGTAKGLVSIRGEATNGGTNHNEALAYAYPNPVRPDYTGPIAIAGLVRDARVKITDVSGTLVYETRATGGQVVWDGNDYNGTRAASGVYLVFSANSEGTESFVTKLVFLN